MINSANLRTCISCKWGDPCFQGWSLNKQGRWSLPLCGGCSWVSLWNLLQEGGKNSPEYWLLYILGQSSPAALSQPRYTRCAAVRQSPVLLNRGSRGWAEQIFVVVAETCFTCSSGTRMRTAGNSEYYQHKFWGLYWLLCHDMQSCKEKIVFSACDLAHRGASALWLPLALWNRLESPIRAKQ